MPACTPWGGTAWQEELREVFTGKAQHWWGARCPRAAARSRAGRREAARAGGAESGVTGRSERVERVGVREESEMFVHAALQDRAAVSPGWEVCFESLRKLSVVTQAILNVNNISSVKGVKDFPGRLACVFTQALFAVATFQGNFSAPRWTHGGRLRGSRLGRWARRHLTF